MRSLRSSGPFLYDDVTGNIVGWKNQNGTERMMLPRFRATCSIDGDSIMSVHTLSIPTAIAYTSQGMVNWALMKAGYPLDLIYSGAVGGRTSLQIFNNVANVVRANPGVAFYNGGIFNDSGAGISAQQSLVYLQNYAIVCLSNGILPVYIGPHANTAMGSTEGRLRMATVAQGMRTFMRRVGGVYIDLMPCSIDMATRNEITGFTKEGTHLSTYGARIAGEGPVYDFIQAYCGLHAYRSIIDPNDATNLHGNAFLYGNNATGSGGFTLTGFSSGNGPDGMTADVLNATGTLTNPAARPASRPGQVSVMNLTFTANNGFGRLYQSIRWGVVWTSGTYSRASWRVPTVDNGFMYNVSSITTGTTAGTEPTWPTVEGATVVDGGVTWKAYKKPNPGEIWRCEFEMSDCSVVAGRGMPSPILTLQNNSGSTLYTAYPNYYPSTDPGENYPEALNSTYTMMTPEFQMPADVLWMTPQFRGMGANAGEIAVGNCNTHLWKVRDR